MDESASPETPVSATVVQPEHRGKALLHNKTVWVVNGFLLLYCGAEVSIGGWIVSPQGSHVGQTPDSLITGFFPHRRARWFTQRWIRCDWLLYVSP